MYNKYLKILVVLLTVFLILGTHIISFAEDAQTDNQSAVEIEEQPQQDADSEDQTNADQSVEENPDTSGELNDTPAEELTSENEEILSGDSNITEEDVVLTNKKDVEIDHNIEGNLYIQANKVTVKSGCDIHGDAFIIADEVVFEENSFVLSNLVVFAKTIELKGTAYCMYASADNIKISGYVYRDLKVLSSGNVTICGSIGRDAVIYGTSNISFTDSNGETENQGIIARNLKYSASSELNKESIPDGVISKDNIEYVPFSNFFSTNNENENVFLTYLLNLVNFLILLVALWFLGKLLAPKFTNKSGNVLSKKQPVANVLMGLLTLVAIPILVVILILLKVTLSLSLFILGLYLILLVISSSIFTIALSKVISDKYEVTSTSGKLLNLLITGFILYLITLIPIVGIVVKIIMKILGLGISVNYLFNTNNKGTKIESKTSKKSKSEKNNGDDEKPSIRKTTK